MAHVNLLYHGVFPKSPAPGHPTGSPNMEAMRRAAASDSKMVMNRLYNQQLYGLYWL